ncbi:MAG TPA: VanZ family protein [Desulfobacterales bacterium]|nr:VanZ family protein [Desulfobacterales bacterium]
MNYRYLALVVLWMGLIFYLSSIPSLGFGFEGIQEQVYRKSAHVIIYGILTLLIWFSLPGFDKHLFKKIVLCGFLAIIFAVSDEIHQGFVPGRIGNAKGVLADFVGIAVVITYLSIRRLRRFSQIMEK